MPPGMVKTEYTEESTHNNENTKLTELNKSIYLYPLIFYRWLNSVAAINWVLVKVNRSSVQKVVKIKENCGTAN